MKKLSKILNCKIRRGKTFSHISLFSLLLLLAFSSCDQAESDSTETVITETLKSYEINSELYNEVTNSVEFEELIIAANNLREDMPSPMDREANVEWDQIFADFYKDHSPDIPFSYYVDNPDIEVPEEIESHYILLIEMNENWQQLRTAFSLTKEESHSIYSTFRSNEK